MKEKDITDKNKEINTQKEGKENKKKKENERTENRQEKRGKTLPVGKTKKDDRRDLRAPLRAPQGRA